MQASQRFSILSIMQAALGGVIAAVSIAIYELAPASVHDSSLTICIAGLGALAVLYFASIHQILSRRGRQTLSTGILSLITAANILLVIAATGGLDSPYYALWLLGIVLAGLFGPVTTVLAITGTTGIYLYEFWLHQNSSGYIVGHLGQLLISLATAGVAEWIHSALGRSQQQTAQVSQLSGQLSQESLKTNLLMQSVGEGIVVINEKRQIQLFNPAAVNLTGWDEKSAQNIDYRLVLNLHDADGNKINDDTDPFAKVWAEGKSLVRNDLTMQTKGGHTIAISLSLSPIFGADKKVTGGIGLFRDISAEKEVERQRNEFISTASHEMRTPVAAIEGYLSLAMNPAVATIDERAKGYLDKAHSSTQHLGALFRDLLSITKVEDGSITAADQEIFDLTAMVKETVEDMQFVAQKKSLDLQFGMTDTNVRGQNTVMPIYAVKGNPQRIREVLTNYIDNAIKFTQEGGIHVTIGGTKEMVTVSVTDTGIGVSPEDMQHLFQKFYRIDSSATRTIGGTGLGLYLCRTIIELFGGRTWVESKLGEGSSFKFALPRQDSTKISQTKVVAQANAGVAGITSAPDAVQAASAPGAAMPTQPTPAPAAQPTSAPAPAETAAKPKKVPVVK